MFGSASTFPVWERSHHARKVDAELNNSCRIITGTLKPTPVPALYRLSGIAPPHIRRETTSKVHKHRQETDSRHPLYNHTPPRRRLKARKSFSTVESIDPDHVPIYRPFAWKEWDNYQNEAVQQPCEKISLGSNLTRNEWVALNRGRTKTGRTAESMQRWRLQEDSGCPCGRSIQTMEHILRECELGPSCTDSDLFACTPAAIEWIQYWRDKI